MTNAGDKYKQVRPLLCCAYNKIKKGEIVANILKEHQS